MCLSIFYKDYSNTYTLSLAINNGDECPANCIPSLRKENIRNVFIFIFIHIRWTSLEIRLG